MSPILFTFYAPQFNKFRYFSDDQLKNMYRLLNSETSVVVTWTDDTQTASDVDFVLKHKAPSEQSWTTVVGTKSGLTYTYTISDTTGK